MMSSSAELSRMWFRNNASESDLTEKVDKTDQSGNQSITDSQSSKEREAIAKKKGESKKVLEKNQETNISVIKSKIPVIQESITPLSPENKSMVSVNLNLDSPKSTAVTDSGKTTISSNSANIKVNFMKSKGITDTFNSSQNKSNQGSQPKKNQNEWKPSNTEKAIIEKQVSQYKEAVTTPNISKNSLESSKTLSETDVTLSKDKETQQSTGQTISKGLFQSNLQTLSSHAQIITSSNNNQTSSTNTNIPTTNKNTKVSSDSQNKSNLNPNTTSKSPIIVRKYLPLSISNIDSVSLFDAE